MPTGTDTIATFDSPTATETVGFDAAVTVGTINLTTGGAFVFTLLNGTSGSVAFAVSTGNAALNIGGTGTAVNQLGSSGTNETTSLTSTLDITISDTSVTTATGALQISGGLSGAGGIIKDGAGTFSFATTAKTYSGATTVNGGVLRTSVAGEATNTSSVTVASGATLELSPSSGTPNVLFGTTPATVVTLNGVGSTTIGAGTVAAGTGALRNDTNAGTLGNNITLASDSTINTVTALTLNGIVSGSGALVKIGVSPLILPSANTFSGGTTVTAGTLLSNNTSGSGVGSGAVTVNGGTLGGTGTISGAVTVNSGGTIQGGLATLNGAANGALTLSSPLTLNTGSNIQITIGSNLGHSTLITNGVTFATNQAFSILETATTTTGTYANIITGLTSDPGTESTWVATGTYGGFVGSFAYDPAGNGIDLIVTAVPEPATVLGGALLVAAAGWSQRRRLRPALAA